MMWEMSLVIAPELCDGQVDRYEYTYIEVRWRGTLRSRYEGE
jgi:hypothetical protein